MHYRSSIGAGVLALALALGAAAARSAAFQVAAEVKAS